ncbi:hypothetical protein SUDANB96_05778 [Streptomyces sp. enrichment culture]
MTETHQRSAPAVDPGRPSVGAHRAAQVKEDAR